MGQFIATIKMGLIMMSDRQHWTVSNKDKIEKYVNLTPMQLYPKFGHFGHISLKETYYETPTLPRMKTVFRCLDQLSACSLLQNTQ